MSGSQTGLNNFAGSLLRRPGNYAIVQRVKDAVTGIANSLGLPVDLFGARPGEIDDDTAVGRYQYSTVYQFFTRDPATGDTEVGNVQFRTTLYTLTPPGDDVKEYIKTVNHLRLHTLFDSGVYEGYMTGFDFASKESNESDFQVVGKDEIPATGLGVPNFSCEVYDEDDELVGHARGYSMDFGVQQNQVQTGADAPQQEQWTVSSFNQARGDYEVAPEPRTEARQRAKNASGKVAYINGIPIGTITSRGTVWMTKEHERPGAATYRSRKYITNNTSTPYQALSPGSNLYKVRETTDGLYFSTVEPSDFDAIDASSVDADATQNIDTESVMALDEDEETIFVVVEDVSDQWALGKYTNSTTVEIDRETDWNVSSIPTPDGQRI